MMRSFPHRAQRLLALICLAGLVADAALAQDPQATAAQAAAREWLALADRADAQASWNAAGKKFQAAMPATGWADALAKARTPLGSLKSRTIFKTDFTKSFPGAPDGDYALIVYTTSFANKAEGHETLTLERESDGKWRVVGYFIR
jgi:hypothetical protein